MGMKCSQLNLAITFGILLLFSTSIASADDISHYGSAPKSPSCDNLLRLVKVKILVDGVESDVLGGLTARFGGNLPTHAEDSIKLPAVFANPLNFCSSSSSKISGSFALSTRGDCDFMTKAEVAQSGGAAGLLVINDGEDLLEMSCPDNHIANITIPVVMISKSGGVAINKSMTSGKRVELTLYSPDRPIVDVSVVLLWLMAVGTIVCASLWSEFTTSGQNDEHYNELSKDSANAGTVQDDDEKEMLDISAKSAIVFVITASIFLVLLYLFMSSWFVWLLIVLFCIGGTEGMHACIVSLVLSKWRNCGRKKVNLPLFGEISVLSLVVLLFCLVFSILWAAKRGASYSWVGQDILLDDCPDDWLHPHLPRSSSCHSDDRHEQIEAIRATPNSVDVALLV